MPSNLLTESLRSIITLLLSEAMKTAFGFTHNTFFFLSHQNTKCDTLIFCMQGRDQTEISIASVCIYIDMDLWAAFHCPSIYLLDLACEMNSFPIIQFTRLLVLAL